MISEVFSPAMLSFKIIGLALPNTFGCIALGQTMPFRKPAVFSLKCIRIGRK